MCPKVTIFAYRIGAVRRGGGRVETWTVEVRH